MVTEFLENEKIVTTVPKAKELRSVAEKMITLGKRDNLHARRQALSFIRKKSVVFKLFDTVAPRFADREGGYTRILRLGPRKGDSAEMAILELVGSEEEAPKQKPSPSKTKAEEKAKETTPTTEKASKAKEGDSAPKKNTAKRKTKQAED
jgi:large subunit ribosomal protein L17